MIVKLANSAGFCFGVSRSVDIAEKIIDEEGLCFSFGQLIHNDSVVKYLEGKNLNVINSISEVKPDDKVIIRAHGVSKQVITDLEKKGAIIVDATCPKVKAIHKIVENASNKDRFIIIIGMVGHPEVEGIKGWCNTSKVFENVNELELFLKQNNDILNKEITVVVQTTQTKTNFDECCSLIKKMCTKVEIFDTICCATSTRQNEAIELSSNSDAMVVIGDKNSANSVHLADICKDRCKNVIFIESANELNLEMFSDCNIVGLTAGASTPSWIIEEVRNKMSDTIKEKSTEELSFDELLEESLKTIYNGEKVIGTVAAISSTEVTVDLGAKYSGFIPTTEFTDNGIKIQDAVKIGDEIEAIVVRVNDVEGTAALSKKRLDSQKFWENIEEAAQSGETVEGIVTEHNKGGIVVRVKGVPVFVPSSQTDLPKDADLSQLLKKNVKLKITEVIKARKRVVGSIRKASQEAKKAASDEIWNSIEVGKKYNGIVKSLTNYGAFVDIGGIDGMIHVTELGWGRINHPSEVVKVGDEINTFVLSFDKEEHRISLGYKDPDADPWKAFINKYSEGDVVNVKVVKLMPFGAFAEIEPNVDGLIHISQVSNHHISKVDEAINVGDFVDAKITGIDTEKKKISLSIKALLPEEEKIEDSVSTVEAVEE